MTGVLHIVLARKPVEGTIAENCLRWGCGALWIDGCRVEIAGPRLAREHTGRSGRIYGAGLEGSRAIGDTMIGRFPANLILGGEEVAEGFPMTISIKGKPRKAVIKNQTRLNNSKNVFVNCEYSDSGSAARFFFNFGEQESDE
jgi:site-specific DNA-methyltransferase (adenine-specific)